MNKITAQTGSAGVISTGATKPLTITYAQHGEGFSVFDSTSHTAATQSNFACSFCASGELSKGSAFFGNAIVCAICLPKLHALGALRSGDLNNGCRDQSGSINAPNKRTESEAAQ